MNKTMSSPIRKPTSRALRSLLSPSKTSRLFSGLKLHECENTLFLSFTVLLAAGGGGGGAVAAEVPPYHKVPLILASANASRGWLSGIFALPVAAQGKAVASAAAAVPLNGKVPLLASGYGNGASANAWLSALLSLPVAAYLVQEKEAQAAETTPPTNDLNSAAADGDLEKLQRLVEYEGFSLTDPDASGRYPLHWAAAKNRTAAVQYIIKHGGDVNATDRYGRTALHISAKVNAIQVAEVLLQEGAALDAANIYGVQIAHVAAAVGHTAFLYHILSKWNADPDVLDHDGRSPLHWAAINGYADCIQLLLFVNAHRGRQDKQGYTPLHWAASKGHLEACRVLVQHGGKKEDLLVTDNNRLTPKRLASNKNHREVVLFLDKALKRHKEEEYFRNCDFQILRHTPVILFYSIWAIWLPTYIRSTILAPHLPKLTGRSGILAWLGVFLASASLFMAYRCIGKDPGYIKMNVRDPQNMKPSELLLKIGINNPTLLAGDWYRLCTTCKIVRPLRTKHCFTCNRCVEQFDHHCPVMASCISKKNKWDYFISLVLLVAATLIAGAVNLKRIWTDTRRIGAIFFLIVNACLLLDFGRRTIDRADEISHNITMNEYNNKMRYRYLKDADGEFRNPYDHGCPKNCSHFLLKGYSEDVEVVSEIPPTSVSKLQNGRINNNNAVNLNSGNTTNARDHGS